MIAASKLKTLCPQSKQDRGRKKSKISKSHLFFFSDGERYSKRATLWALPFCSQKTDEKY